MWLSFLKNVKKNKCFIETIEDIPKYAKASNREILIDTITPQTANHIDALIRFWNIADDELVATLTDREPIKIYINSLGGSLDAAITIMNSIKISKTPVYTFNIGNVYKESFLIYLAGHKRYSYPNAIFMYSDSIFERLPKDENESSFYNKRTALDNIYQDIKTLFLEKIDITELQYEKHIKNDWWFSTNSALKIRLVNEISREHYHYIKQRN